MWYYPKKFDVIVIGAGHAGCEAAHAAARMGASTLLLTTNLDTIGKMSCNPSIGGTAKGHIVREIDALGGLMGKITDRTGIQFRMLNASKGPAVRSPRAQTDRTAYAREMKHALENTPNLDIKQGTIESLILEKNVLVGVSLQEGYAYAGKTVVLSAGTFLRGLLHIGDTHFPGGRGGEKGTSALSLCLEQLGFSLGRLKTGTPPRIHRQSIDLTRCEAQPGDEGVRFSYDDPEPKLPQVPCYITYTTPTTHHIIRENLHRSPLYGGIIQSVGPRYCPSIEDKVVRFSDKERHQLFLEPEGLSTEEIYVNGLSSSLPIDVQLALLRSVPGLEQAEIMRPAYAIEYDYVKSNQLFSSLETKVLAGLFLAGQINGTTGYEEAAGQGLIAGINAACKALGKSPFSLSRSQSYLGVMIDDLIRFELDEPYRMFTSRAEYRLLLRQDNADLRLRPLAHTLGLVSDTQYERVQKKERTIAEESERLSTLFSHFEGKNCSFAQLLCRPEWTYSRLLTHAPSLVNDWGHEINEQIEFSLKYAGYIERQQKEIDRSEQYEKIVIPKHFDYHRVLGMRTETRERFIRFAPETVGQASRIYGISPADLSILVIALQKETR